MKPWLLMDIDGPLAPYAARAEVLATGFRVFDLVSGGLTFSMTLNPAHGEALLGLTDVVDLAWASAWEDEANRLISPILGLPTDLPTVDWPGDADACFEEHAASGGLGCWKTRHIAAWAAGRPFAWFDDDVDTYDRVWLDGQADVGEHLLIRVDPTRGLTEADLVAVREWARTGPEPG